MFPFQFSPSQAELGPGLQNNPRASVHDEHEKFQRGRSCVIIQSIYFFSDNRGETVRIYLFCMLAGNKKLVRIITCRRSSSVLVPIPI
jgi:hypothetical protein